MVGPFHRDELYQLIWSKPVRELASEASVSDVALANMCRKHNIPLPQRGYWAKIAAGSKSRIVPLPPRAFGMPEIIRPGRTHWDRYSTPTDLADMDIPAPPEFSETEDQLTTRVRKLIGTVTIPRNLDRPHHQIGRLLKEDEARRLLQSKARYISFSNGPLFDFPFERRRLRFLSALFTALQHHGMSALSRKKDPDSFEITVGEESVTITADHPGISRYGWRRESDAMRPASTPITVEIRHYGSSEASRKWADQPSDPVEGHATDIVVSIIVLGELGYRQREIGHHDWLVTRKQQIIEGRRKQREEAIRAAAEARVKAEKARVERLLGEASAFRQAQDIRAYVAAVKASNEQAGDPASKDQFEHWERWANDNADRIDPVLSRAFIRNLGSDQEADPREAS